MEHLTPNNHEGQVLPSNFSMSTTPSRISEEDDDVIEPLPSEKVAFGVNPFTSPEASRPPSSYGSLNGSSNNSAHTQFEERSQRYFHSRRINPNDIEKPWLEKTDPKEKWVTIMPIMAIVIGLIASGFLVWDGVRSVVHHKYCLVLDEDWSNDIDPGIWTKEQEVGGFG